MGRTQLNIIKKNNNFDSKDFRTPLLIMMLLLIVLLMVIMAMMILTISIMTIIVIECE